MSGQADWRARNSTKFEGCPLDSAVCMLHAANMLSLGELISSHYVKRCSMRSRATDTRSLCQRQAPPVNLPGVLDPEPQSAGERGGSFQQRVPPVLPGARPPGRRPGQAPRGVVLEHLARRDADQRLSLAFTLLTRASRVIQETASPSTPEEKPA